MTPAEWTTTLIAGACLCDSHKNGTAPVGIRSGAGCGFCITAAIKQAVDEARSQTSTITDIHATKEQYESVLDLYRQAERAAKEWERRAELAAEQYRRRNAEAHALEVALREARRALKFAETILPGGDPMWILEESNANLVLRKNCVPMAIRTIDAAIASQAKEQAIQPAGVSLDTHNGDKK